MPTAGGPNTLGESNLVFAYDTGDTGNSYKGQPTTNLEASNIDTTFETIADGNTAGFNNQLGSGNYLGVSSTMGYKSSKSLKINRGTGGTGRIFKTYSVSTGQYSSVSCWVYSTTAGPYLALEYFGGDYSWGVSYTNNTHTGKGWELLYVRTTGPATSNTTGYYFLYPSIENQDIYLDNIQTELKQYPTTFVNGTRSATQGLLPLIGNSTIDLSNVSFDSSAKMVFDGTNDYIAAGNPTDYRMGVSDFTLECVMKQSKTTGHCLLETRGNSLVGYLWVHNYYSTGQSCLFLNYGGNQYLYFQDGGFVATTTTQYYHMAIVVNRAGSTISFYVNGNKAGNDVAIHSNSISPTGGDIYRVGFDLGGSPWQGEIPIFKHYNRTLSAQEVKQNYQQYKTRFNLS